MAKLFRLEQILAEVRAEIEEMLLTGKSGFAGIHVSPAKELRLECNRNGEKTKLSADEIEELRQQRGVEQR